MISETVSAPKLKEMYVRSLSSGAQNLERALVSVRTKYKNIITGAVLEKSFRPTEKFRRHVSTVDMSHLYNDGDLLQLRMER